MRWLIALAILAIVGAFGFWIWPTPFRHDRILLGAGENAGQGPAFPIRINRFTGRADVLLPQAYYKSGTDLGLRWLWGETDARKPLPQSVLKQLEDDAVISIADTYVSADLYNATNWTLTEIEFEIIKRDRLGKFVAARKYLDRISLRPRSSATATVRIGGFSKPSDGGSQAAELTATITAMWGVLP